jgi:hypothetical protein
MTRAGKKIGRIAGAGAALAIPFLPKCPLCVLPIAAAAGIAVPHGPAVEALVAAAVAVWLGAVLATARWLPVRLAAGAAALAILGGRYLAVWWLTAAGCALMLVLFAWTRSRPRPCDASCRSSLAPARR